ncbi:MAG TPA: hypothetical protein VK797_01700 [Tepidisphaeraceae bacterium]|jgi:hypothetical protein|nr:hypothetical protein [Tepidisphaeraceae bacterium]
MIDSTTLLSDLPSGLRDPLIEAYREIATNYAEHRWEPSELNGGKLCEIVYTILDGATSGSFATSPAKPARMVEACRAIEQRPTDPGRVGDRSLRILLPRLLPYLYEIRNNRGVGHVGGDVNPNPGDAAVVFACASWILAELVRIYHGVSLEDAQETIEALVERKHPIVWDGGSVKRVLDPELDSADQVLLLLYSTAGWIPDKQLRASVEYENLTNFRKRVLGPLHKNRDIEFDRELERVRLTPRGAKRVEELLLPKYN